MSSAPILAAIFTPVDLTLDFEKVRWDFVAQSLLGGSRIKGRGDVGLRFKRSGFIRRDF